MFPHENSVSLCCITICSLRRFIDCNSDNSVQTVKIIGNTCILWQNHILNMFYAELSIINILSSSQFCTVLVFSVCILRPIRTATMKNPLLQENLMEMSEVH